MDYYDTENEFDEIISEMKENADNFHRAEEDGWFYSDEDETE